LFVGSREDLNLSGPVTCTALEFGDRVVMAKPSISFFLVQLSS
jgi:hypothetical protein